MKLCIDCGEEMLLRENPGSGDMFWSCVDFPFCRHAEPVENLENEGWG
jgi:ssDNA-binding Zn-finger/Zn-ribbon topoisomerase 1